jgi:hypothetical protein
MEINWKMKISKTVADFIQAFNNHDPNVLLSLLNENAIIHDEGHDYHGISEIRRWYEEKAVGPNVTLEPIKVVETNGKFIVTAKVDGNFDKTGLPDPLKLDFDFTMDANRVSGLSIDFPRKRKAEF